MVELKCGEHRLTLLPEIGGAVGVWQWKGRDVFLPVANEALRAQKGVAVGAYPLIPYSNRIAGGRFSFKGQSYVLAPNMGDHPHTIHGNAWERAWHVAHQAEAHAVLVLDHVPREGDEQWPFAYRAVLSYVLRDDGLDVRIVVENRDERDQPVGFGFHPFLAASDGAVLRFEAERAWVTTAEGLPVEAVSCEGEWDFRGGREVCGLKIDNCFAGFGGLAEVSGLEAGGSVRIQADPVFEHLVVFASPGEAFVAVEPATNMTDAINHPEVVGRGLHVLKPGERIGGSMRFRVGV